MAFRRDQGWIIFYAKEVWLHQQVKWNIMSVCVCVCTLVMMSEKRDKRERGREGVGEGVRGRKGEGEREDVHFLCIFH